MRIIINSRAGRMVMLALALSGLAGAQTAAKNTGATQSEDETPDKKTTFGMRLRGFPVGSMSQMGDKQRHSTGAVEWIHNTTSRSPALGIGAMLERKVGERMTVTAEVIFQRLRYSKVVDAWWGVDDPSTTADERYRNIRREETKSSLWDLPVLMHFESLRVGRLPSRLWLAGGATLRAVSSIETFNQFYYYDGTQDSNSNRAQPAKRFLVGATVGAGFRFLDDYRTRVTPEVRYTRWSGRTFSNETTKSPTNQVEIGVGITF